MSYIPRYILKRMFPEKDCKLLNKNEFISIIMTNIISAITIPRLNELQDYIQRVNKLQVSFNGKMLSPEKILQCQANYEGKLININTLDQIANTNIPVGGKIEIIVPVMGLELTPGKINIEFKLDIDNPIIFKLERKFQKGGSAKIKLPKNIPEIRPPPASSQSVSSAPNITNPFLDSPSEKHLTPTPTPSKSPTIDKEKLKKEAKEYIKKLPSAYNNISLEKISLKTNLSVADIDSLVEDMIFDGEIKAQIDGKSINFEKESSKITRSVEKTPSSTQSLSSFDPKQVEVLRGGDWKIEGGQSVFFFKVKVKNSSTYVINNIQVILTLIPAGLDVEQKMYKIEMLKPSAFESPTFKLTATQSCVGDSVEGILTFTDPLGNLQSIHIDPFEICYVCNLLTPKKVSREEYNQKTEFMEEKKLVIDSNVNMGALQDFISQKFDECHFALMEDMKATQNENFLKFEGFAEGLYDKQDVALSVAVQKVEKGSQLVVKAMSDRSEKVTDLLRDFSNKLDEIKSDTELIKEYTSQIENILDKQEDMETFLKDHLGSDFEKIKFAWQDYKDGKINKKQLIGQGIKIIGKKFVKKVLQKVNPL